MIVKSIKQEFIRRVYDESIQRINKCLDQLSENEVWMKPNNHVNSVGNLIIHLIGNAHQWIGSGIAGQTDHRNRELEFAAISRCPKMELKNRLIDLQGEISKVLDHLTEEELFRKRKVQVFEETGFSILIHVIEHFSYHTGQITTLTKLMKEIDLKYYGDLNLNAD